MQEVELAVGVYPRDDVWTAWVEDGRVREGTATFFVRRDGGRLEQVGELSLGDLDVLHPALPVGGELVVDLRAHYDGRVFRRQVTFVATGAEDDDYVSAIGPGAAAETIKGRFRTRTRYAGFEFGVLVMGATTQQGTRATGHGALIPHGPGDGVGPQAWLS